MTNLPEHLTEVLNAESMYEKSQREKAAILGISPRTYRRRLEELKEARYLQKSEVQNMVTLPDLGDDTLDVSAYIEQQKQRFKKRYARAQALKWFEVNVNINEPFMIAVVGDPHLDDDGCNWVQLERDIDILRQRNVLAMNIGDTTNNWVGKLIKKYADQESSSRTAWELCNWFLRDAGINWFLWLLGNHDVWNGGIMLMKQMNVKHVPMVDWRAKFQLVLPNGHEIKVDAAHDHKGHSQWNDLHGQRRANALEEPAHIHIAGHRHTWQLAQIENPHTNMISWLARCRGYKFMDEYAHRLGFGEQQRGSSIGFVIDPSLPPHLCVQAFPDLQEAYEIMEFRLQRFRRHKVTLTTPVAGITAIE